MSGEELKKILVADGVVLSDLATALGYQGDQWLHSATKPTKNARFYSGMVKIKLLNSRFSTILVAKVRRIFDITKKTVFLRS